MIVLHKKNKTEHYITIEDWNRLESLGMQTAYKVVDNSEFTTKVTEINLNDIPVFKVELDEPVKQTKPKKVKKTKPE